MSCYICDICEEFCDADYVGCNENPTNPYGCVCDDCDQEEDLEEWVNKNEWSYLEGILVENFYVSTSYEFPKFYCNLLNNSEYVVLIIEGEFINESP